MNLNGINWAQFAFFNDAVFHHRAKDLCRNIGGILYEPKNQSVMKIVINKAQAMDSVNGFWIGIRDVDIEGTFVYDSDKSPLLFTDWNYGQPNDAGPIYYGADCVAVNSHGKWNDLPCSRLESRRSTVCFREIREIAKSTYFHSYLFFYLKVFYNKSMENPD